MCPFYGEIHLALAVSRCKRKQCRSQMTTEQLIQNIIKFFNKFSSGLLQAARERKLTTHWVLLQGICITSTPVRPLLATVCDPLPLDQPSDDQQPIVVPAVDVPDQLPFDGTAFDVPNQLPFEGQVVDVPDQPPFDGTAVDVPDQLPFDGTAVDVPDQLPFVGPAVDVRDQLPFEGSAVDVLDGVPLEGPAVDVPDQPPFDGTAVAVPDQLPFKGPAVDALDELPFEGPVVDVPDQLPFEGSAVDVLEVVPFEGPAVDVPDQSPFDGTAVGVPDQLPFEGLGLAVDVLDELPFEGPAVDVPDQLPFEAPAIAHNVRDQGSHVADNCLITLATDMLPAADLVDDQTVLMLSADYNYQLLVGQQSVPSDKVLLDQLADNSLTTPATNLLPAADLVDDPTVLLLSADYQPPVGQHVLSSGSTEDQVPPVQAFDSASIQRNDVMPPSDCTHSFNPRHSCHY